MGWAKSISSIVHSWGGPSAVWLTVTESGSELEEALEAPFEAALEPTLEPAPESVFESALGSEVFSIVLCFVLSFTETGLRDSALAHAVITATVTERTERLQAIANRLLFILLCPV